MSYIPMSALSCDMRLMSGGFDISVLRARLSEVMEKKGIKPTTLSLSVSKSPTLVRDLMEKTTDTKLSTLFRLANELGVPVADLITPNAEPLPLGPSLYLRGEVAAGLWNEAAEWPRGDWETVTGTPNHSVPADHRFFLRVRGDSMDQVYPEGTLLECASLFGGAEAEPGKRVIVVRKRKDEMYEATVKELVEIDGALWLSPRSSNPKHSAMLLNQPDDDIEEIRISAVVISSVRPE